VQLHPQHDLELNPESHDVGNWSTQSTTAWNWNINKLLHLSKVVTERTSSVWREVKANSYESLSAVYHCPDCVKTFQLYHSTNVILLYRSNECLMLSYKIIMEISAARIEKCANICHYQVGMCS
jgi:hypothetical protein